MGDYISTTNVLTMMPQLPATGEGSTATGALISQTVLRAEAIVRSYIANRYSLPFAVVPIQVREESLALAVYYTYKYQYAQDNMNTNAFVERDDGASNNVFKNLENIRDGKQWLTLTNGSALAYKAGIRGVRGTHKDYQPVFDMDSITSSCVDEDLLDDIADNR